jgi:catechol 2,3-dioxygenase-like lactoylglutathione lyase family enzyme
MDNGGIVFFRTDSLEPLVAFYTERLGASVWREQPDCTILEYEEFHFGFCERPPAETEGVLTFVVPDREGVDAVHGRLADVAREDPHENERYGIYQFFAEDPDGRNVEVQCFE